MGSVRKMLACHCILIGTLLLSTCSSTPTPAGTGSGAGYQNTSENEKVARTNPAELPAEVTTFNFEMTTELPSTIETDPPQDTTAITTSTETPTTGVKTSTNKQSTAANTVKTTLENKSTTKVSTTESHPPATTKKHETTETPGSTTKPADPLTVKKTVSLETSSIESLSTKETSTDSSILGVDKNSFTAKVILPIAAGIILAVFIVLIVCSIRSCLDRKDRISSRRRTMDHDMAPMDRVMLLADSSEDEF